MHECGKEGGEIYKHFHYTVVTYEKIRDCHIIYYASWNILIMLLHI